MLNWFSGRSKSQSKLLIIEGITIVVVYKKIKNINLRITSPNGDVIVTAPFWVSLSSIESLIKSRSSWIKTRQQKIIKRAKINSKEFVENEVHRFLDSQFQLRIIESNTKQFAKQNGDFLELYVKPNSTPAQKEKILESWYREELTKVIPDYIKKYEGIMHVSVNQFGIKKMKTRWGTCNTKEKRIWLNLELAKKPKVCLEYIIVHEMVHLLERSHNKRFKTLMDLFLPDWKSYEVELKKD